MANKKSAMFVEQKLQNLEVELARIEIYRNIFDVARIYKLVQNDQYLGRPEAESICKDILRVI